MFWILPAYRVTLTGTGEVEYEGKALVKITGVRRATLPQEEVLKIVNELLRVRVLMRRRNTIGKTQSTLRRQAHLSEYLCYRWAVNVSRVAGGNPAGRVRLYANVPKELGAIPV